MTRNYSGGLRRSSGIGYAAAKGLIRKAVSAGKRSAARSRSGGKKNNTMYLLLAAAGVAAYFFRNKLKDLFNKKD